MGAVAGRTWGAPYVTFPCMLRFHQRAAVLLVPESRANYALPSYVLAAEESLGLTLPTSVREWYSLPDAMEILAHSNDPPIHPRDFALVEWRSHHLVPIRHENQGVCVWAVLIDGSDDPPVYIQLDGSQDWVLAAKSFSDYVYACVWDFTQVDRRRLFVQAQNYSLSDAAYAELQRSFASAVTTFGWPGDACFRFGATDGGILIHTSDAQADWYVGADDEPGLESILRLIWRLDGVGRELYSDSVPVRAVLARVAQSE